MAGNDRRSAAVERRESMRYSAHSRVDDDYDIEAMGISDGFRPMMLDNHTTASPSHNRVSSQTSRPAGGRRTPPPRPSSISKPRGIDAFALRHDGGMGVVGTRSSMMGSNPDPAPTRSSSVSSDMPIMRAESPYQGPSGPSHPYQMYPQESRLARTASVATTATMPQPERPYSGATGPTHPYGMYPQNTIEPEVQEPPPPVPPVPVGFPGLNNNYQRRLGPEGEEIAGIIGPDGHTEELPPYTQYPDEAFARKARPVAALPPIGSGAGGIGLATRDPEFGSREDLGFYPSRPTSRTEIDASDRESQHNINIAAQEASEKPQLKKWQRAARRRVCHIVPVWVLVLVGIVFVLFGIILGTAWSIFRRKHTKDDYLEVLPDGESLSMTITYDATPIQTAPPNLQTLPTGTYALPITAPSTVQKSCISNTQQSSAWSCTIPISQYSISIARVPGAHEFNNNEINLTLGDSTLGGIYPYGTVPPVLDQTQSLQLVIDSQESSRGPAWFFEMKYNKVVIVREEELSSVSGVTQRSTVRDWDGGFHQPSEFSRKTVAQPGDSPWFCYWNGTLLEGFVYVNLNSSGAVQSSTSSSATPTPAYTTATNSRTGSATAKPTSNYIDHPLPYPKVIKIEERRVPSNAAAPYCIQYAIDSTGVAHPLLNSTGLPRTIYLNETEASTISQMYQRSNIPANNNLEGRGGSLAERQSKPSCGCVWLWT